MGRRRLGLYRGMSQSCGNLTGLDRGRVALGKLAGGIWMLWGKMYIPKHCVYFGQLELDRRPIS